MGWLPDQFFIGHPDATSSPDRPLGQGDVIADVPIVTRAAKRGGEVGLKTTLSLAIVVASSCGMRKDGGELNSVVHVAPVKRLASLAPGWSEPWDGHLNVLPLPGIHSDEDGSPMAADLARIGLCDRTALQVAARRASVSLEGMQVLKWRLATYFARAPLEPSLFDVAATVEWNELELWQQWKARHGDFDGFQLWLSQENQRFPGQSRRDTVYDDFDGLSAEIEQA